MLSTGIDSQPIMNKRHAWKVEGIFSGRADALPARERGCEVFLHGAGTKAFRHPSP